MLVHEDRISVRIQDHEAPWPRGTLVHLANQRHTLLLEAALDLPRFCIKDGTAGGEVGLEAGISADVIQQLAKMGHSVDEISGYARALFGRGQVIMRDAENGALWGGSDPRADGCAMAL